jgi:hypothetical protein
MAYDLILRKQTPSIFSRDAGTATNVAGGVGIFAALALLIVPRARRKIERRAEIRWYRKNYANDLYRTQELPVIPMAEMWQDLRR